MSFVHLHNHSEYSLLNGAIRIPTLVKQAKAYGMPAVALTDFGNMFGAVDFYLEAKKAGIKPILGATLFHPSNDQRSLRVHRRGIDFLFQLVVLIQNEKGYKNLCQLMTRSYMEGFYYKPRTDTELMRAYHEGLIALSGGWDSAINHYLREGNRSKAKEYAQLYSEIFPGRFYLELQDNGVEGQAQINEELAQLGKELGLPLVAANQCHYLTRDDAEAFEALMCVQTGATLHSGGDHLKYSTDGYYFKNIEEMQNSLSDYPEALANTVKIADSIDFDFDLKTYYFPKFDPPAGKSLDEFLVDEGRKGLVERWPEICRQRNIEVSSSEASELLKQYQARLEIELDMVQKMGFAGYFLIVSDFIRYAKNNGVPVGPGRGSAAGSLVAYCTRITDVDPLPYNLLFERFLNPERISMPDVDIDFCMNGRDRVLKYVAEKYGNVSQIITFGKMKAKAVIRDVGRVLDIPYEAVDKIAKLIPNSLNITLKEALETEPRINDAMEDDPQVKRLIEIAQKLEGLSRHASTHAAGVVISDRPLSEYLPLYKGSNNDVVTQYDMKCVEKIGLIKFDFLGLKTLTVIEEALQLVKQSKGVSISILDIPLTDPDVYALLSTGDTSGVFQLESSGMRDLIIRMKPSCFEDLIALVALYRPGPLGSGMVDDFINRKQGKTQIVYPLPILEPILADTYGVIVYQEQVMQIASAMGGYSLGEADILRRAMGKKKADEMASQRIRFLEGAKEKKIPSQIAEKIFDLMAMFAEYGFNKSHSAAYALVSYQTAYLKTHHPVEYLTAVLNSELHDTDRILYYIDDMRKHEIEVLPPNVNEGEVGFGVVGEKTVRYGLGAVKGVGEGAVEAIVDARKVGGPFRSFFDFCNRVDHHKINRRVIESLIKCGAFDCVSKKRSVLFETIDVAVKAAIQKQKEDNLGQESLFGGTTETIGISLPNLPEWPQNEKLSFEKEALGFYLTGHPLKMYEGEIRQVTSSDTVLCQQMHNSSQVTLVGMIAGLKVITTKKGKRMAFGTLEDLRGTLEVIFFSDVFQKHVDLLQQEKPLIIKGEVDRSDEGVKILAKEIGLLSDHLTQATSSLSLRVPASLLDPSRLASLNQILSQFPGQCKSYLRVIREGEAETVFELPQKLDASRQEAIRARVDDLFQTAVFETTL